MLRRDRNNYAFIDGQNLYLAIKELGWHLDYIRFKTFLKDKYGVTKVYMFMGFLPTNRELYSFLQTVGFVLVFKPILQLKDGSVKGNCDAELVLQAMIDYPTYDKAVIVTGDGDFYCLIKYLDQNKKLACILAPSPKNCSSLLVRAASRGLVNFVSELKTKLEYSGKRKAPLEDRTSRGAFQS